MPRALQLVARVARWLGYAVGAALLLTAVGLAILQTGWAKDRLRRLVVGQANQYLTATLEIGHLSGSLFRDVELRDVRLTRNGQVIVAIDDVSIRYGIRELLAQGIVIQQLRLVRPRIVGQRQPDGRWNLAALVKPRASQGGPGRALHIRSIEITEGAVDFKDPLTLGAVHVPTAFTGLDAGMSLDTEPGGWRIVFARMSWKGGAPDLVVRRLTGGVGTGREGWSFDHLNVDTPQSTFTVDGRVAGAPASRLQLAVVADRFAFQEWSGLLTGLRNIAVDAKFQAKLDGPTTALATDLTLASNGGRVQGRFVLDTTTPGWRGKGAVDVARLDLARWLNRPDRPSDISGHVNFDLTDIGLRAGGRFPVGTYAFDGPHAAFLGYEADNVKARGDLIATDARIAEATGMAYGAHLNLQSGAIGIDAPYRFTFAGLAENVDLRHVPSSVPVPHVDSTLAFDFDVDGQFSSPVLRGHATFQDSSFLGASVAGGTVGTIDTSLQPTRYSGEGDIGRVDLHRFGTDLAVGWLQEPRYRGTVNGHFRVEGSGFDPPTLTLNGGGRITQADLFGGRFSNGDVSVTVATGSVTGAYDGAFSTIDPALAVDDERFSASLTGSGRATIAVRDLVTRSPGLEDYTATADASLTASRVRSVSLDHAELSASLGGGTLSIARFHGDGPGIDMDADGALELDGTRSSRLAYNVVRGDLALLSPVVGRDLIGEAVTKGELTGPMTQLRAVGEGQVARVVAAGVTVLGANLEYDATIPTDRPADVTGKVSGGLTLVDAFGQQAKDVSGAVEYDHRRINTALQFQTHEVPARAAGALVVHPDDRSVDLQALSMTIQRSSWQMAPGTSGRVSWDDRGLAIAGLTLVDTGTLNQRVTIDGTWPNAGSASVHVTATHLSIDALAGDGTGPARYGGTADLDAVLTGLPDHPAVRGQLSITDGRVWRVAYDKLAGRVGYADGSFDVDLRLDQRPGVWLTAAGRFPLGIVDATLPEAPYDVTLASSAIDLGLVEGLTSVAGDITGETALNVRVLGTTHDPHFDGHVEVTNAGFVVLASGARYKNGHVALGLATDRITMEAFHLEDVNGDPLEATGSLGTHELRVGDLELSVTARSFEVLRNEFGRLDIDARVSLGGQFEAPRLSGRISVASGALNVDAILDHTMLQSYAPQETAAAEVDAVAALNPWDRLSMDLALNVPNTLRLVGDNVQLSPGTPLGLGDINLRALGDLYLYKGPGKPMYVMGSLDSVTGTYSFQGKRFDLDPMSSINFRGDLTPDVYVMVTRDIAGVETRVTIAGPLSEPELRLSSNPPLESSDILSLIVFNTSTNQLSALQQQQLAVRAGTLAAGFLAAPMMGALERSLGLDTLEIEPGADIRTGTRVTVGNEIAPSLFARFSRQFGEDEYDAATIEYYLSRILRIRATFSDAGVTRSPFRRVERAGVDLLLFFSF